MDFSTLPIGTSLVITSIPRKGSKKRWVIGKIVRFEGTLKLTYNGEQLIVIEWDNGYTSVTLASRFAILCNSDD